MSQIIEFPEMQGRWWITAKPFLKSQLLEEGLAPEDVDYILDEFGRKWEERLGDLFLHKYQFSSDEEGIKRFEIELKEQTILHILEVFKYFSRWKLAQKQLDNDQ